MRRLVVALSAVVLSAALVVGACARPAPAPAAKPAPAPAPAAKPPSGPSPAPTSAAPKPSPQAAPAAAPKTVSAGEFFKNNTVKLVCPSAAGGSTDIAIRLFTTAWLEVTGGRMIVENKAAGGGMPAINEAYKAKPDGLTLVGAAFGSQIIGPFALKNPNAAYDPGKFNYLGIYGEEARGFAIRKDLPYNTMAELQKAPVLKLGTRERTNAATPYLAVVAELFRLKAEIITGYAGVAEIGLAMGKGEIDGESYPVSDIKNQSDKGWAKPMVVIANDRSDLFPNLPTVGESLKLTAEQQKMLDTLLMVYSAGRVILAPPGMPEERLQFLRDSFIKVTASKGFKDGGTAQWGTFSTPVSGKDVAARVAKFMTLTPEDIAQLDKLAAKYLK